ncbi:MAG: tyrosine-type recombinase/integrase [Phycisphaerae bacterium]
MIKDIANHFLAMQKEKAERSLITPGWFDDCLRTAKEFVGFVGKARRWDDLRPEDFGRYRMHLYDHLGVHAIDRAITVVRGMFKNAYESDLIDHPVKYGNRLKKSTLKEKRRSRTARDRANGKRLFEPEQIRLLLGHARGQLRAMILLGMNGGFGNTDCAELPIAAVDFQCGVIDYERPKTAVQRMVPLWPETVAALQEVLANRPVAKNAEYKRLVFLTAFGNPWKQHVVHAADGEKPKVRLQQAVSAEFNKLLVRAELKRPSLGFYALRHTFRTWADETHDQHAIHRIMGHAIPGMSGVYVEEIGLDRLRAVVDHVRAKLFVSQ